MRCSNTHAASPPAMPRMAASDASRSTRRGELPTSCTDPIISQYDMSATSTTPSALADRDYRALARFRYALRVFLRFSEDAARIEGLTPTQHQLLLAVRGHDGD